MLKTRIEIPYEQIAEFCKRWKVKEFALFGSVLREDFRSDSDIDVLLSFEKGTQWSLFDLGGMQQELEAIFNRSVDILTRQGVERSRNPYRKKAILESAQVVHAA